MHITCKASDVTCVFACALLSSGDFSLLGGSKGVSEGGSQTSSETGKSLALSGHRDVYYD